MARTPRIRIRKNDVAEFRRLVRNAKAKINRTIKKYGIDLSGEVFIPENIEQFQTRKQFNEWKQQIESFTNRHNLRYQFRKNPYGVVASKKELADIERKTRIAQRKAKEAQERIKKLPFISGGKVQGTVEQQIRQMKYPNFPGFSVPSDFDFEKVRSQQRLEQIKRNVTERATPGFYDKRNEIMKDNFIRSVAGTPTIGWDHPVIDRLKQISPEEFYELYLMFDEMDFAYYDSEGQVYETVEQIQGHLNELENILNRYERGDINFDLKGF